MDAENNSTINYMYKEDIGNRIQFFTELLHCNGKMYISKYNSLGTLIETNASNMIYDTILRSSKLLDEAITFAKESQKPLILTSKYGMMWAVVFQKDDVHQMLLLHTLGPIFSTTLSDDTINNIQRNHNISEKWKPKFINYLKAVPVVTATEFFKYTLMLHYSVSNEYLKPSDISFSTSHNDNVSFNKQNSINFADYWVRENNLIKFIQAGDIYYKNKISSASSILKDLYPSSDNELEKNKQYATIFCGLCIRAAIDGGISPDTAYLRGNAYLKNIVSAKSFADVLSISHSVFEDFLFQVHNHQMLPTYSDVINSCINFIESHTDEPINLDYLASRLGYSKYYLSKRFKAEVNRSINSYIKKARIDRASYLLVSSKMDIQQISDMLHFGNRNFFTKAFKEETGTNPAAFRNNHKKHL